MEFSCSLCNYTSEYKAHVKRHIITKCDNAEIIQVPVEIVCETCGKTCTTRYSLRRHIKQCKLKTSQEIDKLKQEIQRLKKMINQNPKDSEGIPLRNRNGIIIAYTKIDDEDYENVNQYKWHLSSDGYASGKKGLLHRIILNAKKEHSIVDHINCDKLDNRKTNLRFATFSQNSQNKLKKKNCSSEYLGVSFDKHSNKWKCSIRHNNTRTRTRTNFDDKTHAAYWYDYLALKYYGKEAKINGIKKPNDFIEPSIKKSRNTYKITNIEGKQINRNKDGVAIINDNILVDDDKYVDLIKYTWTTMNGYASAMINNKLTRLHRFIMNPESTELVDHINHNKLDNRISNLRISNTLLNGHNKIKRKNTSSEFIGVYLTNSGKYNAEITKEGKRYYLGTFKTEKEAANARDKKAIELYGNYANLNIRDV